MATLTRYAIEVKNNLNNTNKAVCLDRGPKESSAFLRGTPALRIISGMPEMLDEEQKNFVLNSLKQARCRELNDGRKALPEIITRFGAMVLPTRKVDFELTVHEVTFEEGKFQTTQFTPVEHFRILGEEGKGRVDRVNTRFHVVKASEQVAKVLKLG